jgi:hypothetical protein
MSTLVQDLGSPTCSALDTFRQPVCTSVNSHTAAGLITLSVLAANIILAVASRAVRV